MYAAVFVRGDDLELQGHIEYFFGDTQNEAVKSATDYYVQYFHEAGADKLGLDNPINWHPNHYHIFAGEVGPGIKATKLMKICFYRKDGSLQWRFERDI